MTNGSKQYYTMDGIFIDISSGQLDKSKNIPHIFDAYNHVKISNAAPQDMFYKASPHHLLEDDTVFETYIDPLTGKTWAIAEKYLGTGKHAAQIVFRNEQTEEVYVTYTKIFSNNGECRRYIADSKNAKMNKGYFLEVSGKKTFSSDDFNPYN